MENETSVGRGAVIIVTVGIALGLAHNWVGGMSRPPRGLPWVAQEEVLPDLESLLAGSSEDPATQTAPVGPGAALPGAPPPGRAGVGPGRPEPADPATAPAREVKPEAGQDEGSRTAAGSTTPAPSAPPAGGEQGRPGPAGAASAPYVPDLDRPVQVELSTVKRFFESGAALFIDARDAGEYEAGHIPGAIRLTRDGALAEPERVKTLSARGQPIITYCEGGTCEASLDLAKVLVEAGYRKVLVYSGGFPEWVAAGHPVERGGGGP